MNLSPRNKLIAVVALAVVVVIALSAVLILPTSKRIAELRSKTDAAIKESDTARSLLEQRYQVKSQAAQTDAKLIELAVAIPQNPDLPSLIIDLQDTAYDSGVVLRSVTPRDPEVPEGQASYVGLPIGLEAWGSWADMVDFVGRLQKLPRQLRVNTLSASVLPVPDASAQSSTGLSFPPYYQVRADMLVTAYVIPAASSASSSSVPPAPAATP